MKSKKCTKCCSYLPISDFRKRKNGKDGLNASCKVCDRLDKNKYYRKKHGLVIRIYNNQTTTSRRRGHNKPSYTRKQLHEWLYSQRCFHEIYDNWVLSGYDR